MNTQNIQNSFFSVSQKFLLLLNFFLIIFAYHILRDLKDTLIVTSCETGAKIIPFLKIWAILPFAVLGSYIFQKLYFRFGRSGAFYILVSSLSLSYLLFAFFLFPYRELLHGNHWASRLEEILPSSFSGFTNMIRYWSFSLFYALAEMWSILVISVLFWSGANEITPQEVAKRFFPTCVLVGNIAGITSGQISCFICRFFNEKTFCQDNWNNSVYILISLVFCTSIFMMIIHHFTFRFVPQNSFQKEEKTHFKESIQKILKTPALLCITALVVGFALTSNLFEVIWKNSIKNVYKTPAAYNAYVNQITTIIGIFSLILSFLTRYLFRFFKQSSVLLITPVALLITSSLFFLFLQAPYFSNLFHMSYGYFIMTFGSIHYVLSLTAKYALFDTCKEMAFLSIDQSDRIKAKSVIDSVGSRLGKSGSSLLHQFLLILFATSGAYIPLIATLSLFFMVIIFYSAKKLGRITEKKQTQMASSRII